MLRLRVVVTYCGYELRLRVVIWLSCGYVLCLRVTVTCYGYMFTVTRCGYINVVVTWCDHIDRCVDRCVY